VPHTGSSFGHKVKELRKWRNLQLAVQFPKPINKIIPIVFEGKKK